MEETIKEKDYIVQIINDNNSLSYPAVLTKKGRVFMMRVQEGSPLELYWQEIFYPKLEVK